MDIAAVLAIFRLVAGEFGEVSDLVATQWVELTAPLVSKKKFGALYSQALALLTAHRMKMAGAGLDPSSDPMGDMGSMGVGSIMRVGTYSEGEVSVGFNSSIGQYTADDAEFALTPYGIQYLSLRRMCVMPIVSAGWGGGFGGV